MTATAHSTFPGCERYDAPADAFWLCGACCRWGTNRAFIGDESCFSNAILLVGDGPRWSSDYDGVTMLLNEPVEARFAEEDL